jgi:uncharacterized protein RhaS with RHS repeats
LGRFICEDPIRFEGGDVNLYRYAGNAPATFTDPFGLTAAVETTPMVKKEVESAPAKLYVACLASEMFFTVAFAMIGFPPDLQDIAQSAIDCVADVATGGATKAKKLKKLADKGKDALEKGAKELAEKGAKETAEKGAKKVKKGKRWNNKNDAEDQLKGVEKYKKDAQSNRPEINDPNDQWDGVKKRPKQSDIESTKKSQDRANRRRGGQMND